MKKNRIISVMLVLTLMFTIKNNAVSLCGKE